MILFLFHPLDKYIFMSHIITFGHFYECFSETYGTNSES